MLEKKIEEAEKALRSQLQTLAALRKHRPAEEVADYVFQCGETGGNVTLSQLFGGKRELIAVHNMGISCPGCTAWSDGFSGLYEHLADRTAFVVTAPDKPEVLKKLRQVRNWKMPLLSSHGNTFTSDMGFTGPDVGYGTFRPGVSTFRKEGAKILRTAYASFGPGDVYNPVPHLFDLLEKGSEGWFPRLKYSGSGEVGGCH